MVKAYSYIRMSTDKQAEGDSYRRQRQLAEKYCKDNGLELDDQFKLLDVGYSAYTGEHIESGALGLFLKAVEARKIPVGSFLLVESHDRLSRMTPSKALPIFLSILNSGIFITILNQNKVFAPNSSDPFELMYAIVEMVRSHGESKRRSGFGTDNWEQKRANINNKILTRLSPGWVMPKSDLTGFMLEKARAEVVRLIFDLAHSSNMGSFGIAKELNRRGIGTFGRAKTGWQKSSIDKILTNRAVIGECEPHRMKGKVRVPTGQVTQGYFPPVIDESLFYAVQHKRQVRKSAGGGRIGENVGNLFTKMARCGYCEGAMHLVDKGSKGGKNLVCDTARRGGHCRVPTFRILRLRRLHFFMRKIRS